MSYKMYLKLTANEKLGVIGELEFRLPVTKAQ
jgi:hypothetical protein